MRWFNNMSVAIKLPAVMVMLSLTALAVTTAISFLGARAELREQSHHRLMLSATAKSQAVQSLVNSIISDLRSTAANPTVAEAIIAFRAAYHGLPTDNPTAYLQRAYITENPHPTGEKDLLQAAEDGTSYSDTHRRYHDYFHKLQESRDYYDVFLFAPNGDLVYSVFKETDFATNFLTGQFRDSGLGQAFRASIDSTGENSEVFADFAPYAPSNGAAASFVSTPVRAADGTLVGVLAYQLPTGQLVDLVGNAEGLDAHAEALMVGEDGLLRSSSRLDPTRDVLSPAPELMSATPVEGEFDGVVSFVSPRGEDTLAAYAPVTFLDTTWRMFVTEDAAAIDAPAHALLYKNLLQIAIFMAFIIGLCVLLARSISRPLNKVEASMRTVSGGDLDVAVPFTGRKDEIGHMASALEEFRTALQEAKALETENLFKGAAFNGSSAALMMVDKNFNINYMNQAVQQTLRENATFFREIVPSFDPDAMIGVSMDVFHKNPAHIRRLVEDPSRLPYQAHLKIGEKRFSLYISAIHNQDGEHLGNVVEWQDATEQSLNSAILAAIDSHQCTARFYPDGTIEHVNENLAESLGGTPGTYPGQAYDKLFQFDPKLAEERGPVWPRLCQGESVYGKFRTRSADGGEVWLEGGFSPVMDNNDTARAIIFMGSDVSQAERALRDAEAERKAMTESQATVVDALRVGLNHMADGDLTTKIDTEFSADYEQLRTDFNLAADRLLDAMRGVVENAQSIRGEAGEISNAADDLSRRTEKQAATLEQTAAALDELTSSVQSASDGAVRADQVVNSAKTNAEASGEVVREAVSAMGEIENSSEQISKIISVIDDIAFQTNLLALNAGVEAARAGEAGRGFAVVASEVRALAQRSSDAAREINDLISASSSQVKRGVDLVRQAGDALEQIVESVSDISSHVSAIAVSSREQSSGLAEINTAVNQLDQVTQQNAAMFEQTTAASHALTREAESLSATMAHFRIDGSDTPDNAGMSNVVSPTFDTPAPPPIQSPVKAAAAVAVGARTQPPADDNDGWEDF